MEIALQESTKLTEVELNKSLELLKEISNDKSEQKLEWLLDTTEKFCQEKAIYNAIMDSIQILDGKDTARGKGSIPTLLSDVPSCKISSEINFRKTLKPIIAELAIGIYT